MKIQSQRVSFRFGRLPDGDFQDAIDGIIENLFGNPSFPEPPIGQEEFVTAASNFSAAKAATVQGGTAATAEKNLRRAELYAMAKENGAYVTAQSKNDLSVLLSSGYEAISTNRTSHQLLPPTNVFVKNGVMNQSLTTANPVKNARGYEMQYAPIDESGTRGEWIDVPFSTSSRNIPVDNLVSGSLYVYRVCAKGGLTGQSDWSESVTHRAY